MNKKLAIAIAATTLLFVGCASNYGDNMSMDKKDKMIEKSTFLTDSKGMALYTFDKDTRNKSNCYNGCEIKWPVYNGDTNNLKLPIHVKKEDFGIIQRDNGTMQVTYKSQPLYYFFKDTKAYEVKGDGAKGVWHLVKPSM
jgi:predicted lipoprotein with Yx(FWY)xxD motif